VVAAKAKKRTSGMPVRAPWVARKAWRIVSGVLPGADETHSCLGVLAGVVSEFIERLFAAIGWEIVVRCDFDTVSHFLGCVVHVVTKAIHGISSCLEDGGHGGECVVREQWMMMDGGGGGGCDVCCLLKMQLHLKNDTARGDPPS
jgi:hypothetical protein